jgi:uncharacterized protein
MTIPSLAFSLFAACSPAFHASAQAAPDAPRELLVWEARKGGVVNHVMGTCHLPIPLEHALPAPHHRRLRKSRTLISELDLGALLVPEVLMPLMWNPNQDLRASLGEDAFRTLAVQMRAAFPSPVLRHLEPWLVGSLSMLPPSVPGNAGGFTVLDHDVAKAAAEAGLRSVYLETPEEQLALMSSLNTFFARELVGSSAEGQQLRDATELMSRACYQGDLDGVATLIDAEEDATSMALLLDRRNTAWRERVVEEAERGGAFFAVGAGHLVGPTGLLSTLEQSGFVLERLTTSRGEELAAPPTSWPDPQPAPAPDAEWLTRVTPALGLVSTQLCGESTPVRTCYAPDAADCRARLEGNLAECAEQHHVDYPADPTQVEGWMTTVFGCAIGSMVIEAIATDRLGDDASCVAQREPWPRRSRRC